MKSGRLGPVVFLPKLGGRQQVRIRTEDLQAFVEGNGERPPLAKVEPEGRRHRLPSFYGDPSCGHLVLVTRLSDFCKNP